MPRYKPIHKGLKLLPVDFDKQVQPGSFEHVHVFGNIRGNKRLDRFTLRGRNKVDGQWKLYCLMHNIEKLAHHGYGV